MTTITTRLGKITGSQDGRALTFLGIRYAEPPTGDLRFLPPVGASPWPGTADGTRFPNRPMQPQSAGTLGQSVPGELNEDCLFLNIVTPAVEGSRRPVLVWIHGGGFTAGSANEYDGSVLAEQGDVIVVTINYRLGAFGFLNLAAHGDEFAGSASNAVRDQILALQWVRDNIADYGGDPGNVTLFGESAGGTAVLSILAAPSADGLYHKAVAHSAMGASMPPDDITGGLAARLDIEREELVPTLRAMPAAELQALGIGGGIFIDGTVITRSTNAAILERGAAGVPIIAGTNRDEGTLFTGPGPDQPAESYAGGNRILAGNTLDGADPTAFIKGLRAMYPEDSPREIHERIWVDMFRRQCIGAAESATAAGPGGWLYRFDLSAGNGPEGRRLGATHASEMAFTFNTFANPDSIGFAFHDRNDGTVRRLAEQWSNTILAMARTGDPNGAGLPAWPRYSADDRRCLILDADPRVEADSDEAHRVLWGDA